ncbi:hypothetical protein SELMODRAFT_176694 [Selaginella moellendorffii]|uniref:Aquaporin n=1 Tax=Selaginella moellendorffii TaxID=88036 RepID=D8S414_SELML|nr:aquaporin NIP6-1 [Selaginella moellendorffii]EFJ20680.1 hypothetical protein SELMODRAFT_176694 [Selaginella moellendorffii]|eukprot:XP_002978023.1 aquaporin NIP6-1 [Selaginella moellendorffii]
MGSGSTDYALIQNDEEAGTSLEPVSGYSPSFTISKKLLCEFLGSVVLLLGGAGSAIINTQTNGALGIHGLAGGSAIAVAIVIMSTGHISGAHINPAVTLAFATFRHFSWIQVPLYIVAQLAGSLACAFLLKGMYNPDHLATGVTVPAGSTLQSLLFEIVLTAVLMFVITSVATDTRAVGELAGIAVGLAVYLDILLGGYISGASMNPVRTLGPAVAARDFRALWIYFVGPVVGAQIGGGLYTLIRFKDHTERRKVFRKE